MDSDISFAQIGLYASKDSQYCGILYKNCQCSIANIFIQFLS